MPDSVRQRRFVSVRVAVAALAAVALGCGIRPVLAASRSRPSPPCIILLLDGIAWDDIDSARAPALKRIAQRGAVGLMNVGTRAAGNRANSCLSIGAGESAVAPSAIAGIEEGAFNVNEQVAGRSAADVYSGIMGERPGDAAIVFLGMGRTQGVCLDRRAASIVAKLGAAFSAAGRRVACVGNADTDRAPHREGVAIVMNRAGLVPLGDVGPTMREPAPSTASGWATHIPRLLEACDEFAAVADLLVVDGGDTARVREYAETMASEVVRGARRAALARLDPVVARLAQLTDASGGHLLVISPVGIEADGLAHTLTPIIVYGRGVGPGLVTSASTRRPGLVASSDVLPTVLSWLKVPPAYPSVGRPITVRPMAGGTATRTAAGLGRRLTAVERGRRSSHDPLIIGAIVLLSIGAIGLMMGERAPRALVRAGRWAQIGLLGIPLSLLIGGIPLGAGTLGLAAAAVFWLIWMGLVVPMSRRPVWGIATATALVIAGDLAFGGRLASQSVLGHSAFIGVRYYGLGNEYGGVLIWCVVIAVCAGVVSGATVSRRALWGCAAVFLGAAVVCGQSHLGANLGIALSMAIAGAAVYLRLAGARLDWRAAAWMLGAAVLVAAVLVIAERLGSRGAESHIGQTASLVEGEHRSAIWAVIARKAATNWRLVQNSIWAYLGVAALAVFAIAGFVYPHAVRSALGSRPWLSPALVGIGAGSAAAFVLNDSGVVSASLALAMGAAALTYLALDDQLSRSRGD